MTEAELNSALAKMLASLGDRYTRYLPPAKYATIVQVGLLWGRVERCLLQGVCSGSLLCRMLHLAVAFRVNARTVSTPKPPPATHECRKHNRS